MERSTTDLFVPFLKWTLYKDIPLIVSKVPTKSVDVLRSTDFYYGDFRGCGHSHVHSEPQLDVSIIHDRRFIQHSLTKNLSIPRFCLNSLLKMPFLLPPLQQLGGWDFCLRCRAQIFLVGPTLFLFRFCDLSLIQSMVYRGKDPITPPPFHHVVV